MTEQMITVDPELARQALGDVLDNDAARQPAAEPPPRRVYEGATPEAPYGYKADGSPRKSPPGPGRPRTKDADSKPRTEPGPSPSSSTAPATAAPSTSSASSPASGELVDYSENIASVLLCGWMGLSAVPFTQAHALMIHQHMGELTGAWNKAAQQNASIRRAVLRLSGEGSWGWVIPVAATTTPFVVSLFQVTIAPRETKLELRARNQDLFRAFLMEQAQLAGLPIPAELAEGLAPPMAAPADPNASPGPIGYGQSEDPGSPTTTASSGHSPTLSDSEMLPV